VTDIRPGEGMTLMDEFDPQAEPQHVREISGSRTAHPGMLMAFVERMRHRLEALPA
jgi:hypothetical protein